MQCFGGGAEANEKDVKSLCCTSVTARYDHEETVATKSFASKCSRHGFGRVEHSKAKPGPVFISGRFIVLKNMTEAEYVAAYMLGEGNKEARQPHVVQLAGVLASVGHGMHVPGVHGQVQQRTGLSQVCFKPLRAHDWQDRFFRRP